MILIPRYRDIEANIKTGMRTRMAGWYKMVAIRPDGRERVVADWFPNLITDVGLAYLGPGSISAATYTCQVGTGTNPPQVTDTSLQALRATANPNDNYGRARGKSITGVAPDYVVYHTFDSVYRFLAGTASGNLTEVGVRYNTSNPLYSRALILDASGNPTSITILADEVLDVHYQHRMYYDVYDHPFSAVISGVTYNGIARLADWGGANDNSWNPESVSMTEMRYCHVYNGALGAVSGHPAGTYDSVTMTQPAYTGNRLRTATASFVLTNGNMAGGIKAARVWNTAGWTQFSFTPAIPKDATKTLTLNFANGPWDRYTP